MSAASGVEDYLARQPAPQRAALERLRTIIRGVLPDAEEVISYGLIGFRNAGRPVVWIAGWKKHVSVYPLSDAFFAQHADALRGHEYGKGTLRFRPDEEPPSDIIEELVRSRVAEEASGR